MKKKILIVSGILLGLLLLAVYPTYLAGKHLFRRYFDRWGTKLVALEKRGLLSKEYGAAWEDVLMGDAMHRQAEQIVEEPDPAGGRDSVLIVDGVRVDNYPSLRIIARLNEVHAYTNTIEIVDRRDRPIALIRTDHKRGSIEQFPQTLLTALLAAEDERFYDNSLGIEFDSYVRAALTALWESITTFSDFRPSGTSTITQQVAKLFISDLDEEGQRFVSRSVDRKIREMRIAAAMRKMYRPEEILEVYLNHCVTSDYGLIGYRDIANGLLGKKLDELSDAECIYLARMVKWGRNIHERIARQCRIDMPRMAAALGWSPDKQQRILAAIDSLTFTRPERIKTDYGYLVDCANEFWLTALKKSGREVDLAEMNIIDPNSLIRKKGNLKIRLTIDLALQRELERLVDSRGYGPDTVIVDDVRIGSRGETVRLPSTPRDTLRHLTVIDSPRTFAEPNSHYETTLERGDTLITNIRYRKAGEGQWRRSEFYYTRRPVNVDGQYYAYCILDSRDGTLLAYYSRDRIGSRLAGLLKHRTPNGSSTAKPIFNALNFDLGVFRPYDKWSDLQPVRGDVAWKRTMQYNRKGRPSEVVYTRSAVPGRGYRVHNHDYVFDGCQYIFDLLATSNNILGVETVYRLDRRIFDRSGRPTPEGFALSRFFYRIGAFGRIKNDLALTHVTGVRVYKELARIVGVDTDSITVYGRRVPVSDSLYSVGLGTLELTLYEQAHLFNMLYNNDLIEHPADHPSLAIDKIELNGVDLAVAALDTVRRVHPFAHINNLRPTYLGMHKRLVSNQWDGLGGFDVAYRPDSLSLALLDTTFSEEAYRIDEPLSNYAKSGTTDDILRPFNAPSTSRRKTNYGHWNAIIRIDLAKLSGESESEVRDVTIACIGECNRHYTGARDGKSLHKFLSRDLLKKAGVPAPAGFYTQYEAYLQRVTPDSVKYCGRMAETVGDSL
jgi:hypothetical protein